MSWQAGVNADIQEQSKAWKIRATKIRSMKNKFKSKVNMGCVLNEIKQNSVFNKYIQKFITLENLKTIKIDNDEYEFKAPKFELVLKMVNFKDKNILSYIKAHNNIIKNLPYITDGILHVYFEYDNIYMGNELINKTIQIQERYNYPLALTKLIYLKLEEILKCL